MDQHPYNPKSKIQNPKSGELAALGIAILVLLVGMLWLVGFEGVADTPESVGSSHSAGRRGTQAMYEWLGRAGYDVERVSSGQPFPPSDGTLIMVNPNADFPEGQAGSVRLWLEEGHTLILATGGRNGDLSSGLGGAHPMLRELGIDLEFNSGFTDTVPLSQPLLSDPPVGNVKLPGVWSLAMPVSDTVVLASSRDSSGNRLPLAALLRVGEGRVFVLSSDYPLSNEGIRDESNGAFVYNLVRAAGNRRVVFDEAHHGASVGGDLIALLTGSPWGWALLYGVALSILYVVWSGRRLGPPLPVWTPDQRRPTSDYVRSVAALFRRARKPGWAAERYLQYLKRTLSKHAELDPYLTDQRFVQSLAERGRHTFNQSDLAQAIDRLRRLEGGGSASETIEAETLAAIRDAEKVRREALGMRNEG
jgi:Domain of unknown function (DUF4350)